MQKLKQSLLPVGIIYMQKLQRIFVGSSGRYYKNSADFLFLE